MSDIAEVMARRRAEKANATTPSPKLIAENELTPEERFALGIDHAVTPEAPPAPEGIPQQPRVSPRARREAAPQAHKPLPQSIDAEKGTIGSILLAPAKVMAEVQGAIGLDHYQHPAHKTIYQGLLDLHGASKPIDFISLTQYLDDQKTLDSVGGAAYITELFTFVPTASNAPYYIGILQEKYRLREIILGTTNAAAAAHDQGHESTDILDDLEEKIRALRSMAGRNGKLPDMDDMIDITGEHRPPAPPELVKGLLHQGSKIIIGGTSKGRKTFALMDLAVSVATGTPWWGCETIKGKVCYINFEIQRPFFAQRFEIICQKKGVTPDKGMFMCWTLRGMVEGMELMADQMIKSLIQYDFALIVVDPIYKALGDRDENKAGDVASLLNELERIAVRTGAAIAFGAHYSKGNQAGKESMDRIGGSGVFARDPDAIIAMTPHEEPECFTVEPTLRNFPPMPPFVLQWEYPLFRVEEVLNPADLKKPARVAHGPASGQFQQKYSADDLYTMMAKDNIGRKASQLQKLASDDTGISKPQFYRIWNEFKKSARVVQRENGMWYTI